MSEWDEGATQIRSFSFDGGDKILIADANRARCQWLRAALGDDVRVEESDNSRRVFERLTADPPRILVVGTDLVDVSGTVLLAHCARHQLVGPHRGPIVFLLADDQASTPNVDETMVPIFYRITPDLQPVRVRELFQTASSRENQTQKSEQKVDPVRMRQVVEHAKKFGIQTELKGAATIAENAVIDVCRADRARVLYFDDDSGTLWHETKDGSDESPASAGITGFVARTGMPTMLERANADPAYRPNVDDPAGTGNERLMLQPVRDRDNNIHAVLVAVRDATREPFTGEDKRLLQAVAEAWGPFIHQLALESEAQVARENATGGDEIFRQEAVNHLIRRGNEGDVVRVNPAWVSGAYWIVLAALGASAVFGYFVHINTYSEGPAAVRVVGRDEVISYDSGTVTSVEVKNGDSVKAGQTLVKLHDVDQASKLRSDEADFERKLVAYLQNPADEGARTALGQARTNKETSLQSVSARNITATTNGIVKDLRVRSGQRVEPGAVVAQIARPDRAEGYSVYAFLKGGDRPRLRMGQPMRLTLPGYRGVYFDMTVKGISTEVLGAKEAGQKFLGDRMAEQVGATGTVVVVEGHLTTGEFFAEGEKFKLHEGMLGTAEVKLESKSVLSSILPGLDL